ncbi:MAG: flagellar filament capping protein FliD [Phycisphaerales bacterium]|nr:flagellar filament capping protein FliD [Phycisphaerales bacterium]
MGGIQSQVGIFSGINTGALIEQLLSIEARPKIQIQQRVTQLQQQRAAFLDINSDFLALKTTAAAFRRDRLFDSSAATPSNADVLRATASTGASVGTFQFIVDRLVSTQSVLSRGFADKDTGAVGASGITLEVGGGSLARDTALGELNGGQGVARGKVQVRDKSGATATIDLSKAATVGDVLDAFNNASGVTVRASVQGDRLVITDGSGGAGNLMVSNASGSTAADSLGIAGTTSGADTAITGARIRTLSGRTALSTLNDGNGVNIRDGSPDFRITARDGTVYDISLGQVTQTSGTPPVTTVTQQRATTVQDVIDIINKTAYNAGTGKGVRASVNADGTGITLTDSTGGTGNVSVSSLSGRTTAEDLGISTAGAGVAADVLAGRRIISALNSSMSRNLRGGQGVTAEDLTFTDRAGNTFAFRLSAAARAGSISDMIDEMNQQLAANGVRATVGLNRAGNGLSVRDTSGGTGNLTVVGAAAQQLGIATAAGGVASTAVNGSNLDARWIGLATEVSKLNNGRGIGAGTVRITDASGKQSTLTVGSSIKTVDELVRFLQTGGAQVEVSVNAKGDGLSVKDTSGGSGTLRIEDVSGTVARSLNLAGSATRPQGGGDIVIDGSYERTIALNATDTLQQVADKINNSANSPVQASIIRDGSAGTGYRLQLTSKFSGAAGRAVIDTGDADLGFSSLIRGDDARVFFGSDDPSRAILLTSSTNTLDNVSPGLRLDLRATSAAPVTVSVTRDNSRIEKAINDFVGAYNEAVAAFAKYDTYNADTNKRGTLLGDSTLAQLRAGLSSTVQGRAKGVGGDLQFLSQIGVRLGAGGKLSFDTARFRDAFARDPDGVRNLVAGFASTTSTSTDLGNGASVSESKESITTQGVMEMIATLADKVTNSVDGVLTRRDRSLAGLITAQNTRIGQIDQRLASRRQQLETQFQQMEAAIGQLQQQQRALGGLSGLSTAG